MTSNSRVHVPRQLRRGTEEIDEVERAVARTADLVLKLTALADRYEPDARNAERVAAMREAVQRGRRSLVSQVLQVDSA